MKIYSKVIITPQHPKFPLKSVGESIKNVWRNWKSAIKAGECKSKKGIGEWIIHIKTVQRRVAGHKVYFGGTKRNNRT